MNKYQLEFIDYKNKFSQIPNNIEIISTKYINYQDVKNKSMLTKSIGKPIQWLQQIHSAKIIDFTSINKHKIKADGLFTRTKNLVCAILTADCLPIILFNDNQEIALIHAGWQGLFNNIIKNAFKLFYYKNQITGIIGPGIDAQNYEVDLIFKDRFITKNSHYNICFQRSLNNSVKFLADLKKIAIIQLKELAIKPLNLDICTFNNLAMHSFRRDKKNAGRLATLVWIC